jgi:hypothetical protein
MPSGEAPPLLRGRIGESVGEVPKQNGTAPTGKAKLPLKAENHFAVKQDSAARVGLSKLDRGHLYLVVHNRFLPLDLTKVPMSFSPERRKSRKSIP